MWLLLTAASGLTTTVELQIDNRPVTVAFPSCANTTVNGSVPLIISLHAWGTTAAKQQGVDNFAEYATPESCFVTAYPQGFKRAWGPAGLAGFSWNAGGCCPDASDDKVDDVLFAQHIVQTVRARFPVVHPTQLFISGLSNGGMMANRLACELDGITAVAAVSGPLINGTAKIGEPFACERRVPLLHIHGLKDPIVPFGGCNSTWNPPGSHACKALHQVTKMGAFPSVEAYIERWRERNGVATATARLGFQNGTVSCQSWGDTAASNVTLCVASDEGHAWPGDSTLCSVGMFRCTLDMDASAAILAFFGTLR